jgi:hypothetical protein
MRLCLGGEKDKRKHRNDYSPLKKTRAVKMMPHRSYRLRTREALDREWDGDAGSHRSSRWLVGIVGSLSKVEIRHVGIIYWP